MRSQIKHRMILIIKGMLPLLLLAGPMVHAGNDPSIKGALRTNVQAAMDNFIKAHSVNKTFNLYDPVEGKMHKLKFDKLHKGIVKKGDFYVSCADFVGAKGRKFDLDFLVLADGDKLVATQAIVHSVDGKKRKYHLEN